MERVEVQGSRFEGSATARDRDGEQGFMLLGLMVAIAIILLFLGVAASDVAYSLRREKELESARRADQYVRAIRLFDLKYGRYPGSIEALEDTNHIRYLRQRYVDPLTGRADYRLIVVGQNKTTVKGFFGQPLGGLGSLGGGAAPANGDGTATGPGSGNSNLSGSSKFGGTSGSGSGVQGGGGAAGGGTYKSSGAGVSGEGSSDGGAGGSATGGTSTTTSPIGSPVGGSGPAAMAGPIMGVGSSASGPSILTVNGQTSYEKWEFLYDPRLEQLKVAAALNVGQGIGQPIGTPTQTSTPRP